MDVEFKMPDLAQLKRDLAQFPKQHALAVLYANNRGATSVRAKTLSAIARETGVRSGDIRKQSRIGRATSRRTHSRVWIGTGKQFRGGAKSTLIKRQPIPNPPRFLVRLNGRPPQYYYRDPVKTMRNSNKSALRAVRADLTEYVERHLPEQSAKFYQGRWTQEYNRDFLRRIDRLGTWNR